MTLDSGISIASFELHDGKHTYDVSIETQGYVNVFDNKENERYRCASDMPEELVKAFAEGTVDHERYEIMENNWYEVFVEIDGEFSYSDCMECDPCDFENEEDIKSYIIDWVLDYIEE